MDLRICNIIKLGDSLEIKLEDVKGVGPQNIKYFRNHGIWSTYDLVLHVPKTYEDFSITSIDELHHKQSITLKTKVETPLRMIRGGKTERIIFRVKVFHQLLDVVVFGRGYLLKQINLHDEIILKGTYDLYRESINASSVNLAEKQTEIKPIYGIENLHDKSVSNIVKTVFDEQLVSIYETLPKEIVTSKNWMSRKDAYHMLHLPKDFSDIEKARQRLKYEEAFFLQLKLISKQPKFHERPPKAYDIQKVKDFIQTIPYELTSDQKNAVNDIFRDFKKNHSTYRLIQGDVGSGKTMVSMIAILAIITAGEQVSFMAPTELLAKQHFQTFTMMLKDVRIALLTGKTKDKETLKKQIEHHEIDLVIGTHALIEEDVKFAKLGFIVIDEQHKFGVKTREELILKSSSKDVLYLTATPIPRTLALIEYGNQHVSIIREKPKSRQVIQTRYITKPTISEMYDMMYSAIIRKEHIFLVVPAITSSKVSDNIETVYESISAEFKVPIFVLHGKLTQEEKDRMMDHFIYTPGSIMIATTMIEVGIDIPTATLMGIYSAESFGLSQLHQLRGRVGRGNLPSFCYLISEKEDIERLETLSKTDDGFKLAEYDLIERGPGDFLGSLQSGYIDFKFLSLLTDEKILLEAQKDAETLISKPDFKTHPDYRYLNKFMTDTMKI